MQKKMLDVDPVMATGFSEWDVDRYYPFIKASQTGVGVMGFVYLSVVSVGFGMLIFAALSFILSAMPDSEFKTLGPLIGAVVTGMLSTEVLARLTIRIAKGDYGRIFFEEATDALYIRWVDSDGRTGPNDAPKIWTRRPANGSKVHPDLTEVDLEDYHKDWIAQVWLEVSTAEKARPKDE
jgi:hypothetical protein